jgi:hypothetical protein
MNWKGNTTARHEPGRSLPHLIWFWEMNTCRRRSRTGSRLVGASRMVMMVVQCDVHCVGGY